MRKNSKNIHLINNNIKCEEVLLIISETEKKVTNIKDALQMASTKGMDLVQVSPAGAKQAVCKMMDYGKFCLKKKNESTSKNKVKRTSLKEIKFRPSTDTGDYNIKLKKIKSFINEGNKTKISVRFRGREILNSDMGLILLNKLKDELSSIAQVDQEPSLEEGNY